MQNKASFQIKTLIPDHNCAMVFDFGALVTYKWIARHYVREIVSNPKISGLIEHYGKLWDYRDQFLKTNPGSTVKLDIEEVLGAKTYFKRFCFKAMKDGWTEGCRKVISLDGCFLKGTIKGELLTMFPIAWVVVTVENSTTDGHKGLKEAVREWLPLAEHRQCARHIYANLKKSWPGLHFKSLFWGAASATLKHVFDEKMKLLRVAGKRKGGQNGFESAASALKRMRMDATASGSGLSEEEHGTGSTAENAFDISDE
ncbi:hypothetical protein Tco_1339515 [Tanacetum coccineum]